MIPKAPSQGVLGITAVPTKDSERISFCVKKQFWMSVRRAFDNDRVMAILAWHTAPPVGLLVPNEEATEERGQGVVCVCLCA